MSERRRLGTFRGLGLGEATSSEIAQVNRTGSTVRLTQIHKPDLRSPVEGQVCLNESIAELQHYFSGLSDAEKLAIQAKGAFTGLDQNRDLARRIIARLEVPEERLEEIKQVARRIVLGKEE